MEIVPHGNLAGGVPPQRVYATRRAVLADALVGRGWSVREACDFACVCRAYVARIRQMSEVDRWRLLRGEISLAQLCNGNGHKSPKSKPTLAEMLASASPSERAEAAAKLGVATVWDEMVAPLIDQERSSQQAAE
jgi:hypothetical protein